MTDASSSRAFTFIGGDDGQWSLVSQRTLSGEPVALVARVDMVTGFAPESLRTRLGRCGASQ
jgi:hypothetical protein